MKLQMTKDTWLKVVKAGLDAGLEVPATMIKEAKWGKEDVVDPKKKGMWDGYSQEELKSKLEAAKARQEKREKADPEDSTLIKQLQFALRSKHDWGKVKASTSPLAKADALKK